MNKVVSILLVIALLICMVGCKNESSTTIKELANEEVKAELTKVIKKEANFVFYNKYNEKTTEENIGEFRFSTDSNALQRYRPVHYTFLDFDNDGIEEALIFDVQLTHFLFLKYKNEKVYGYLNHYIDVSSVKTNGSFTISFRDKKAICSVTFSETEALVTYDAYMDDSENQYTIGGKASTKSETEEFFAKWKNNTTNVTWEEYLYYE